MESVKFFVTRTVVNPLFFFSNLIHPLKAFYYILSLCKTVDIKSLIGMSNFPTSSVKISSHLGTLESKTLKWRAPRFITPNTLVGEVLCP